MGKRQEAALETRRKIVAAVNELLKEKSLNEISIEDITTKAGVAKGSFYTYFKRKEDAACCLALDKYDSVKKEALNASDGIYLNLCIYLKGSAKIIDKYTLQSAQAWMKSVTDPIGDECRGVEKYSFDRDNILELLNGAVARGELSKNMPTEVLAEIIMNAYYGAVAVWCITSGDVDLIGSIEHFCEYGLKAILKQYKEENHEHNKNEQRI